MNLHKYSSLAEYTDCQIRGNKQKLKVSWVRRNVIEAIADYIKSRMHPTFGICHGTRMGREQAWFRELLGIDVIGTEISDTATQFPHTIQWDFHYAKKEWLGAVDFIYSNSLDHSHSPRECVETWLSCLRPEGLCFIEWSKYHGIHHVNWMDCFGASIEEMREFLPVIDELHIVKGRVVFILNAKGGVW